MDYYAVRAVVGRGTDRNGSSNIYKIARNAINNIDRPSYLCRETSNQSTSTSAYNQTILRV